MGRGCSLQRLRQWSIKALSVLYAPALERGDTVFSVSLPPVTCVVLVFSKRSGPNLHVPSY